MTAGPAVGNIGLQVRAGSAAARAIVAGGTVHRRLGGALAVGLVAKSDRALTIRGTLPGAVGDALAGRTAIADRAAVTGLAGCAVGIGDDRALARDAGGNVTGVVCSGAIGRGLAPAASFTCPIPGTAVT
jgi:hypothetical protein